MAFRAPYRYKAGVSKLIYVETTIPSFYTETRTGIDVAARRIWTRQWWSKTEPGRCLVTSAVVFDELERIPDGARRAESLALVRSLEQLDYTEEIAEIADVYIHHKLMPMEAVGDADHLALASFYNCEMFAHMELPASGQCKQSGAYPPCQRPAWVPHTHAGDTD